MGMRNSLSLSKEEVDKLLSEGKQYVVRFLIQPNEEIVVNDLIRGEVKINSSILDDKVLYKSADELPTYHLANIVDDHLMEIYARYSWRRMVAFCTSSCFALSGFWLARYDARNLHICHCC
jgi:hypothetical protein